VPIIIFILGSGHHPSERLTSWCLKDELVKGDAFTAGLRDSGACGFGKAKSSDAQLRHFVNSLIISNSGDNNSGAVTITKNIELNAPI